MNAPILTGPESLPESIQIQLKKGVLEMCVLTLLARGDSYGYEIFSKLLAAIGMGEGTIYPLMRRMQNEGLVATYLVESTGGAPRKYYKITDRAAPPWWRSARSGRTSRLGGRHTGRRRMTRDAFLAGLAPGLARPARQRDRRHRLGLCRPFRRRHGGRPQRSGDRRLAGRSGRPGGRAGRRSQSCSAGKPAAIRAPSCAPAPR